MYPRFLLALVTFVTLSAELRAQKNWQLRSPDRDNTNGAAVDQAYELLKGKSSRPVIVAVIDIGTDISHEDLRDVIWTNDKEVPGNGIDDDSNGYTDDVHGWNFIGGKGGDLEYEAVEETRIYQGQKRKWANADTATFTPGQKEEYAAFKKIERQYYRQQKERVSDAKAAAFAYKMNKRLHWKILFRLLLGRGAGMQIEQAKQEADAQVIFNIIDADSMRRAIVGDDPGNAHQRYYGNNHVTGPEASHGTHTAGIIGAVRNNHKGLNGVAGNVRIMVIRTIPWGDERDKDVSNAIRYAVDNGASVINMSFGKAKSPTKQVVDSAIAYAIAKDVLLVHSAGNEGLNTDSSESYPNVRQMDEKLKGSWIEVGATGRKPGKKLTASFSNYGRNGVDMFAPGVAIYSSLPGNKYGYESGTSMAGPVVAGVAALIRSYFPELKAAEVKAVLMNTVTHYDGLVRVPGKKGAYKKLEDLCISGGIVNAEAAVRALLHL